MSFIFFSSLSDFWQSRGAWSLIYLYSPPPFFFLSVSRLLDDDDFEKQVLML